MTGIDQDILSKELQDISISISTFEKAHMYERCIFYTGRLLEVLKLLNLIDPNRTLTPEIFQILAEDYETKLINEWKGRN